MYLGGRRPATDVLNKKAMVRHGTDAKKGHTMVAEMLTSGWTYVNPG